jgi:hypothetical protein
MQALFELEKLYLEATRDTEFKKELLAVAFIRGASNTIDICKSVNRALWKRENIFEA